MKTPFTILYCFAFLSTAFSNYLIDGPVAQLSIQTSGKIILIPGEVDGVIGYFMLDTGAPELILNKKHFPGQKKARKVILQDVEKKLECRRINVRHFIMGSIYRDDFQAIMTDLSATEEALGREILGLLGYDVLRHFELRIDYYAGFITFCALDKNGLPFTKWQDQTADHSLNFRMEGHLPVIKGSMAGKQNLVFGLDSGASVNLMDRSYQAYLKKNCLKERSINFQCIHSKVEGAPFFVMPELNVEDHYQIEFWRTSISDFSHFRNNDIHIHAILGANFFQLGKLMLNYRQKKIEIWDDPSRLNRRYKCIEH